MKKLIPLIIYLNLIIVITLFIAISYRNAILYIRY